METEKFHLKNNSNPVLTPKEPRNKISKVSSATEDADTIELVSPQRRIQSAPVKQTRPDFPRVIVNNSK